MKKMTTIRSLAFALLALHATVSEACRVSPARQMIPPEEQLQLTTDVAVGQVIGATPLNDYQVEYRFLTLERLAGAELKVFTVTGGPVEHNHNDTTYNDHSDFAFWAHGGGRTMNGSDCVIRPGFVIGNSYLVFLGMTPTRRSFEKIELIDGRFNPDDKWLVYVKQMLSGRAAGDDGVPAYERIGRFIYSFHRIVSRDELDRKALAARHAPAELLSRAGRLADEFDRIVQNGGAVADVQIDVTLREAAEVQRALAAWERGSNH